MSRLANAFQTNQTNLIPYLVAGYPSVEATIDLIHLLAEEGVTAIELGVPFSDPVADGPIIQLAAEKALSNGITLSDVFAIAQTVRDQGNTIPLILFSYYNPLLSYGLEKVAIDAEKAGFSGFIVPDLPYEESDLLRTQLEQVSLDLIPLVAPTSEERVAKIAATAKGFVYCVSSLGTTGVRQSFASNLDSFLQQVRSSSRVPIAVGFGVSTASQVQELRTKADGVIVGSALVKQVTEMEQALCKEDEKQVALNTIRGFVKKLLS
ncbi:tryptophan synthase subunit alpha [Shimazuella kribbensis]|uniref:tryptophan synthase subunit alpha n=1 Tax=Shimazuella kribbensis TaxID=139808 RepID=UPI00040E0993|nr:tryptophan synthase subunit alpha [Shimazuella kribbensis]